MPCLPLRKRALFFLLAVAAVAGALSCNEQPATAPANPPSAARGGLQGPDLSAAIAAQEHYTDQLLARAGVVGTAVGLTADGRPAVKIFAVSSTVRALPSALDGVPVVVEVTGEISAIGPTAVPAPRRGPPLKSGIDPTGYFTRPVPIGVSTGNQNDLVYYHSFCTSGTIGARLKGVNGSYYALSNNHVYAVENMGQIGDPIVQPGQADLGCRAPDSDRIGTLAAFVPLQFGGKSTNVVDGAVAAVTTGDVGTGTPSNGYGAPSSTTADPAIGLAVQKYGRTTSLTTGTVNAVNATIKVKYSHGIATFTNQIGIGPSSFSGAGDSGSLIVTQNGNNPVALLFAGSSTTTFANPIGPVLQQLGALAGTSLTVDGT